MVPSGQTPTLSASSVLTSQFNQPRPVSVAAVADNSLGFSDLIDIVNPLQHIPVINTIYQDMTGDSIKPIMSVAGGMLFGGPIGAVVALISNIVKTAFEDQPDETVANPVNPSEPDVQSIKIADDTGGKQDWNAYQHALVSLGVPSGRIDNLRPRNFNAANVQQTYPALNEKKDEHANDTGGKQDWNAYQHALVSLGVPSGRIDNLRPRNINAASVQQTYSALNDKKDAHAKSGKITTDALTADDEKRLFAVRIRDSV